MCKFTSTSVLGVILAFGWLPSSAQALPADQISLAKCQLTVVEGVGGDHNCNVDEGKNGTAGGG